MFFRQIYEKGLAHASYMVGCQQTGTVAVIDAKRDVDTYLRIAEQENLRITQVLETHIHADFLCGSRELRELCGAEILLSDEGGPDWQYEFEHHGLRDGDVFMNGNIRFQVLHTPGHTPEHICFLVTDTPSSDKPMMLFSGDFVFVGDVGRPDLLERAAGYQGTMEAGARQLYDSLQRFRELPDYIQVHPAHGAGSACGKALGDIPHTTVGYEKMVNWALKINNADAFVEALLEGQPEPPTYFATMKKLNKEHRSTQTSVLTPPLLGGHEFDAARSAGAHILDTRNKIEFSTAHIPGSLNIQNNNALSTWAGWMLDYVKPIVLISSAHTLDELCRRLMRIGMDNVTGYVEDISFWTAQHRPTDSIPWISVTELHQRVAKSDITVLDVRKHTEFIASHVPSARHIHTGYVLQNESDIPRTGDVAVICQSGNRSTIACSALKALGFTNLINVEGGMTAWENARFPVESGGTEISTAVQ